MSNASFQVRFKFVLICPSLYFHAMVSIFFFCLLFFPCLISAVADWMSTILAHMMWP